jgi:GTPase
MGKVAGMVALVGRPNVGKSTLFNLMTRSKNAIVDDMPGVTRDRLYGICSFEDENGFTVIDTGGFEKDDFKYQPFSENLVWKQTEMAIDEADVVVLLLDGKSGLHQHDYELVRHLEDKKKNVIFAVNKLDGLEKHANMFEFYSLGLEEDLLPVSAAHNRGVYDLVEEIDKRLNDMGLRAKKGDPRGATRVALIGRPNAGKSSVLNRITGSERALVSEVAGTTRDSVDTYYRYENKDYVLIDTAGIRRKTKIDDKLESASVIRSLRVLDDADLVVLVIDAIEGITDQDARLAQLVIDRCKPLLLVVNKWDLVPDKNTHTSKMYSENVREKYLTDIKFIPIEYISCMTNQRVHNILREIDRLSDLSKKRVPTAKVNEALEKAVNKHNPQVSKKFNKRIKFYYCTQVKHTPPTFVIMCNVAGEIQEGYKRYLTNRFREYLGFDDIPIKILYRNKSEQKSRKKMESDKLDEILDGVSQVFTRDL